MDRYKDRPFLQLLECYILDEIGHLNDRDRVLLKKMEPSLTETFGSSLGWKNVVKTQMDFPDEMPDHITMFWEKYKSQAKLQGSPADPVEFAMMFVDQNFPEIFE